MVRLVVLVVVIGACGGERTPLRSGGESPPNADQIPGSPAPGGSGTGVAPAPGGTPTPGGTAPGGSTPGGTAPGGTTPSPPAPTDPRPPPPAGPPLPCEALIPGRPEALVSFEWQVQREACQASMCFDFLAVGSGCELKLQRRNNGRVATANATDCAALKRWVTSTPVVAVLSGPQLCVDTREGNFESFVASMSDGRSYGMKTFKCPHPALDGLRSCLSGLLMKYFP